MLSQVVLACASILVFFVGRLWSDSSDRSGLSGGKTDEHELADLVRAQLDRCGPVALVEVSKDRPGWWSSPEVCFLLLAWPGTLGRGYLLGRHPVGAHSVTSLSALAVTDGPPRWHSSGRSAARLIYTRPLALRTCVSSTYFEVTSSLGYWYPSLRCVRGK